MRGARFGPGRRGPRNEPPSGYRVAGRSNTASPNRRCWATRRRSVPPNATACAPGWDADCRSARRSNASRARADSRTERAETQPRADGAPRRRPRRAARPVETRELEIADGADANNDENARPALEGLSLPELQTELDTVERADEATASWRDSRGARGQARGARGGEIVGRVCGLVGDRVRAALLRARVRVLLVAKNRRRRPAPQSCPPKSRRRPAARAAAPPSPGSERVAGGGLCARPPRCRCRARVDRAVGAAAACGSRGRWASPLRPAPNWPRRRRRRVAKRGASRARPRPDPRVRRSGTTPPSRRRGKRRRRGGGRRRVRRRRRGGHRGGGCRVSARRGGPRRRLRERPTDGGGAASCEHACAGYGRREPGGRKTGSA